MAGSGSFNLLLATGAAFTFSRPIGSGERLSLGDISANAVAITLGAGSSHFS